MKATDIHRIHALSVQRRIHQENTEKNLESQIIKSKEEQAKAEQLARDDALAVEIERLSKEAFKEIKLRQQLRESSPELRELESKLYTGYCNKEVAAQLAEKEAARMRNKLHEIEINKMMEAQRIKAELKEKEKIQEYHNKKLQYKRDLDEQMYLLDKKHQKEYEEFIKEKAALDDINCSVKEENQREETLKLLKMEQMKKDIEEFRKAQELWKQKEKQAVEEEFRNIREFLSKKECEDKSKIEEVCKKRQEKLLLQEKIALAIKEQMDEREERETVIQDLALEKSMELQEQKFREQQESEIRNGELLRESYRKQLEEKKQKLKEEEQLEATYKQQMLEKLARDEELEKMTAEKQRIKKMQHRREVQEILEERHRRRVEEMQTIIALEKLHELEEAKIRTLIEEERMKMLKTHATNVQGYLPKGVYKKDEAPYFGT